MPASRSTGAEQDVAPHVEMRKEREILRHVADAAAPRRHVDARGGVEEHVIADRHAAAIGPAQSRNHLEQRRLAGAGWPDDGDGAARARLSRDGEREGAGGELHVEGERAGSGRDALVSLVTMPPGDWRSTPRRNAMARTMTSTATAARSCPVSAKV